VAHRRVETLSELRGALAGQAEGLRVIEASCPRPHNHAQHARAEALAAELALEVSCLPR